MGGGSRQPFRYDRHRWPAAPPAQSRLDTFGRSIKCGTTCPLCALTQWGKRNTRNARPNSLATSDETECISTAHTRAYISIASSKMQVCHVRCLFRQFVCTHQRKRFHCVRDAPDGIRGMGTLFIRIDDEEKWCWPKSKWLGKHARTHLREINEQKRSIYAKSVRQVKWRSGY